MVVEAPRIAASVESPPTPVQPPTLTIQSYVIPQGKLAIDFQKLRFGHVSISSTQPVPPFLFCNSI